MLFRNESPVLGSPNCVSTNGNPALTIQGTTSADDLLIINNSAGTEQVEVDGAGNVALAGTLTVTGAITATGGVVGSVGASIPALGAPITASGAISPHASAIYFITKSTAPAVMTLADPTATTDDGVVIIVVAASSTVQAHTITATGSGIADGTGGAIDVTDENDLATFAAHNGAGIAIIAYQGKWSLLYKVGVTMSDV